MGMVVLRISLHGLLVLCLLACFAPRGVAEEEPGQAAERARKQAIRDLGKDLRKEARNPRPLDDERRARILKQIEALEVLGGPEAAIAALGAVPLTEAVVRDAVFALVDKEHGEALVGPLAERLDDNDYRRDTDLRKRIARSLSIAADAKAVPPLTGLVRTDEDADVVAAAADALATYASAKLPLRKDAVKALIDVYTSTYNLMLSMKPEQRVIADVNQKRWKIFARPIREALQALTGQSITRPQDWRTWWNKNKKKRW